MSEIDVTTQLPPAVQSVSTPVTTQLVVTTSLLGPGPIGPTGPQGPQGPAGSGPSAGVPLLVGLDYAPRWANGTVTRPTNVFTARPFLIARACTVDRLSVFVNTAGDASAVVRLALYADNGAGVASRLVDAGTVPGNVVGVQSILLGTPVAVPPGWLLAGAVCTYPTTAPVLAGWPPGGVNADGPMPQGRGFFNGWSVTATGGVLPASFNLTTSNESDTCAMVSFRIAS